MKSFRQLLKRGKANPKKLAKKMERAERSWVRVIYVGFLLLLVVVALGVYVFFDMSKAEIQTPENVDTISNSIIDQDSLHETIKFYEAKEVRFLEYQNATPTPPRI